jgi:ubiquinone/menaquinone biosynthesis C-methylase UbiE
MPLSHRFSCSARSIGPVTPLETAIPCADERLPVVAPLSQTTDEARQHHATSAVHRRGTDRRDMRPLTNPDCAGEPAAANCGSMQPPPSALWFAAAAVQDAGMPEGSGYVLRGGRAGADRLRVLARSLQAGTDALLDQVRIPLGANCLDVGCGAGDVTLDLARRVGAAGRVTAVDADGVQLEVVRERAAAAGLGNIDCVVCDIDQLPDMAPMDVVYSRNVLQHLADPVDAVRRMWAQVGAGGALVAEDADFDATFCYPPQPAFDFWIARYSRVLRSHGGDPQSGRKLAERFAAAGITSPEIRVSGRAYLTGEAKQLPYLTLDAGADAMIGNGVATEAEITAAVAELRRLSDDASVLFGMPLAIQVWARRA